MLKQIKERLAQEPSATAAADRQRIAELEERLDHERLYPLEWANRRVRDAFGNAVLDGPFAGLRYPDNGMTHVDLFAPKILAAYEREIHVAVEAAIDRRPSRVVNIGAADGYYAVGLARRLPHARAVAFEAVVEQHAMLAETARLNGVEDRVDVRGTCDPAALAAVCEPGTLVVCDCEGCERELMDPAAVPALRESELIVEMHDVLIEGLTPLLRGRFEGTHSIEEIRTQPRHPMDFPQLSFLPLVTRQLAISEFREGPMSWLVLVPR